MTINDRLYLIQLGEVNDGRLSNASTHALVESARRIVRQERSAGHIRLFSNTDMQSRDTVEFLKLMMSNTNLTIDYNIAEALVSYGRSGEPSEENFFELIRQTSFSAAFVTSYDRINDFAKLQAPNGKTAYESDPEFKELTPGGLLVVQHPKLYLPQPASVRPAAK